MRQFTDFEMSNSVFLAKRGINFTFLEPTATGLKKSIMDATTPVRLILKETGLHDYETQSQGPDHKQILKTILVDGEKVLKTKTSLYRPNTKMGDPRIWISGLPNHANCNDIILLIPTGNALVAINITNNDLSQLYQQNSFFKDLIDHLTVSNSAADELLSKLKAIAKQCPIRAERADTMIGRLLETLLGIEINSSKNPDYKGIEIKSFRDYKKGRENRVNLFASVADWDLSPFKSSAQILDTFGYMRGPDKKLYCTVSTQNINSQGLSFRIDEKENYLVEYCNDNSIGDVAVWALSRLHSNLLHKHKETFWVSATSVRTNLFEDFTYTGVLHTQRPITAQFDLLLYQGNITMDHLIKRVPHKSVVEKGPLFKINRPSLYALFPEVGYYDLN